jgi:hypothetical protein
MPNYVTSGTVTNAHHDVIAGNIRFLVNAEVSPGSMGGALVNTRGQVVGILESTYSNSGKINSAIPSGLLKSLKRESVKPFTALNGGDIFAPPTFGGIIGIPSFSVYSHQPLYYTKEEKGISYFYYKETYYQGDLKDLLDGYTVLLRQAGFHYQLTEKFASDYRKEYYKLSATAAGDIYSVAYDVFEQDDERYLVVMVRI